MMKEGLAHLFLNLAEYVDAIVDDNVINEQIGRNDSEWEKVLDVLFGWHEGAVAVNKDM
jgi:hypothetical protein